MPQPKPQNPAPIHAHAAEALRRAQEAEDAALAARDRVATLRRQLEDALLDLAEAERAARVSRGAYDLIQSATS